MSNIKTKPFNLKECMEKYGGKCITREGQPVRIVATDRVHREYSVIGFRSQEDGTESVDTWTTDGVYTTDCTSSVDLLLPIKMEKRKGYVNVYHYPVKDQVGNLYTDRRRAVEEGQSTGGGSYLTTVEIEYEVEV